MLTARRLGVTTRTIYYYIERYPEVAAEWKLGRATFYQAIVEAGLARLLESIQRGEPWAVRLAVTEILDRLERKLRDIGLEREEKREIELSGEMVFKAFLMASERRYLREKGDEHRGAGAKGDLSGDA